LASIGVIFQKLSDSIDIVPAQSQDGFNIRVRAVPPFGMRHSDIKLTMKIYTDSAQLSLANAVYELSPCPQESTVASITDIRKVD